jgi:hypothetical protein
MKHGLHLNKYGNTYLVKQIISIVHLIMEKRIVPPMGLGWPVYFSDNSVNSIVTIVNETDASDVQSKATHILVSCTENKNNRTSKRNKKLPFTRRYDFYSKNKSQN